MDTQELFIYRGEIMESVLGLDVGVSSVGWALVDPQHNAKLQAGVRVFPEGVDRDTKGGEKSKTQNRRVARGTRRQIQRRARRKRQLRMLLTSNGLLPPDANDPLGIFGPLVMRESGVS